MAIGIAPPSASPANECWAAKDHPVITPDFLNAVLRLVTPIRKVQILNPNPTSEKEFEDDKWSLLDRFKHRIEVLAIDGDSY